MQNIFHKFRQPVLMIIGIIILSGLYFYGQFPISLFPEITFPKIKVIADYGDQPVEKMMITVTRPLEDAIKQVPDLKVIRSTTSRGNCEISAFLTWKADINISLQMLELRINQVKSQLPSSVQIEIQKMNPSILPVMGYTLESNIRSPIELNLLAKYTVKPYLSQVEGVSEVGIIGGKTKEYWLILDPQKMSSFGITPGMISTAANETNFIMSNGLLTDYRRLYLTVTDAGLYNSDDIGNVVIRNDGRRLIRIRDVSKVEVDEKIEYTRINANGKPAILVAIIKQPATNLISISNDVREKVKGLRQILPSDVKIEPYYDQADFVKDAIKSVKDSLLIGLLLALLVAVLFLRSFRASITMLITIPVTLLLTVITLYSIGFTLNIMTLGAIAAAIGLVIDDAVVVIEQIHRTHEENHTLQPKVLVNKAVTYLFPSLIGSSISTIVIFIPFMLMSGVAGAYFKVLTDTMIVTLICSFFVTWLGLPVIYLLISGIRQKSAKAPRAVDKQIKRQGWVLTFIRRPWISLAFILFLVLSIIYIIPRLKTGFLPAMDEGSIVLDYTSPPGSSLEETDRMLKEVEKIIVKIPEYESYSRRTGAQMGFFITEPNYGDYLIQLKKNRKRSTEQVIEDLRQRIEATQPALRIDFGQVIGDMLGDLMSSVQPIEIKIFGDDQDKLQEIARQVAAQVEQVDGTADVFDGITIAGPSVQIVPKEDKLSLYNLSPSSFQFQLQTQLEGNIIGGIMEKEQYTNIRMVYPEMGNNSVEKIKKQFIFLPDGRLRPITDFASILPKKGSAEIQRENLQLVSIVSGRLNGRDLGSVMKDIQKRLSANISLPQGYYINYGGDYVNQQKSFNELLMILLTASLLVFALMLFLFRDFKAAAVIFFTAVLGTAGSLIALYLTQVPLNVGSYTGVIMIVGIIGENAIFTMQQYKKKLKENEVDEALTFAISTRLRPNLMTALAAIMALSPLALGIGTGAQMHQPLAIAVIGGFIVAIPLLLIILPTLLRLVHSKKDEAHNRISE